MMRNKNNNQAGKGDSYRKLGITWDAWGLQWDLQWDFKEGKVTKEEYWKKRKELEDKERWYK